MLVVFVTVELPATHLLKSSAALDKQNYWTELPVRQLKQTLPVSQLKQTLPVRQLKQTLQSESLLMY